ncbi:unnamed protein product [Microthlaspi erraticum]|uniref:Reverse transcriptase domain-containing protein n=1 Tax=Microthlaspi erraticum TaxID=1685480 RepID=A0A6D2J898_9BRAS|nr:unnamed protein product [Microthlaspi erraticum]
MELEPGPVGDPRKRPFRFEAAWLKHPGFKQMLEISWNKDMETPRALEKLKVALKKWNRDVFGDIQKRKEVLLDDIKAIQDELELIPTDALLDREEQLLKEMDEILEQEEIMWFQKSREKWIALGDHNTSRPFAATEVEKAVRSMGRYKAPGPDGYQPIFYQENWKVVGEFVARFALEFFRTGELKRGTNDAIVVLIPKVMKPEKITQFRPISLCNVLFKTITKTMVMRLKKVMQKLIGPAQSSFIPGRLSADNIVLVQEAVHSMKKKKGRRGWMLLKLDLEKAYDRIRWDFLEDTLKSAGLPESWIQWILQCVTGPDMSLLWNGERTEAFQPQRGLRQGDPLSPYLFVLCMERLCHLIDKSVIGKKWKPIRL